MGSANRVRRRSARAIVIDENGRLVLIKRTKPGRGTYGTTPGGGVEESDATPEAALHRELTEELGATATSHVSQVLLLSAPSPDGLVIDHLFVARLVGLDESRRYGPEFSDPGRGTYDVERVDLAGDALAPVDLKPAELKDYILANRDALLVEVGLAG